MKTRIYDQHIEHSEWLMKLSFYADESKIIQKRIDEISVKNSAPEVRMEIEHFQNQLFIQNKNLQNLKQTIKLEEKSLITSIIKNPIASDHRKIEDHVIERESIEQFEKLFNEYRREVKAFLSRRA